MRIAAPLHGALSGAAGLLLAVLTCCATPPSDPADRAVFEQNNDPLEPLNRKTLAFNMFIDRILLKPVTKVYIAIVPEEGREAVKRALDNMKEPIFVINDVLQGEFDQAGVSVGRFTVNTTLGLAGLFDVAAKWGLDKQKADFGQTLYVWGLPEGPYLIVPILGPSNPRDLIGMGADAYIDPFSFLATKRDLDEIQISRFLLDGIDQRARVIDVLDDLQKNSLDFYAQLRSLSQQRRAAVLRHGKPAEPGTDLYQDPGKSSAEPPPAAPEQAQPNQPAPVNSDASPPPPSASRNARQSAARRPAVPPRARANKPVVTGVDVNRPLSPSPQNPVGAPGEQPDAPQPPPSNQPGATGVDANPPSPPSQIPANLLAERHAAALEQPKSSQAKPVVGDTRLPPRSPSP